MRRFSIFCAVACGLLLIGIGATPSYFREISVGGGYGSAAQGDDPAGGIWLEDGGNLLMDGDLTVDGDATVGGTLGITGNTTIGGTLTATGGLGAATATSITTGTLTATTGVTVSRPAASTATLTLTNSTGTNLVQVNGANLELTGQSGVARLRIDGATGAIRVNGSVWPISDNVNDLGSTATTSRFRNLFLGGDATIGGGDIFGPTGGTLNIESTTVKITGATSYGPISTFAADATTPSVAGARLFKPAATGHTGAVAVTALTGAATGQEIIILGVATNETWTLTDGSTLANMNGNWVSADGTNIHLVFDGTNWFEIARR